MRPVRTQSRSVGAHEYADVQPDVAEPYGRMVIPMALCSPHCTTIVPAMTL
jgi:hypothetical protein